jgi:archaellum component FlaF (FlaF/FlaG flagellin family)
MVQKFSQSFNFTSPRLLFLDFFLLLVVVKAFALPSMSGPYPFIKEMRPKASAAPMVSQGNHARSALSSPEKIMVGTAVILIDDSGLIPFEANVGEEHVQSYYIEAYYLAPGESVVISVSDPSGSFTVSTTKNSGFSTTIELPVGDDGSIVGRDIWVRYAPAEAGGHTATIDHAGGTATQETVSVEGNATALPVEWLSFKARATQENIVLEWITASEKNNSHFEVEISNNPVKGFEKIGRVASKAGNSHTATDYRFAYHPASFRGPYYFRLRQVDTDNTFAFSKIIVVEGNLLEEVKLKVDPNPLKSASQIRVSVEEAGVMALVVSNSSGTEVFRKTYALESGENVIPLYLNDNLAGGMYIFTTLYKGKTHRLKLVKE